MTQVKEWSNQELNRKLAELMGWTVEIGPVTILWRLMKDGKIKATSGESKELMWSYAPDYSNDPAASLEVQAKAGEIDKEGYSRNLQLIKWGRTMPRISGKAAFEMMNASPRERAEAAYITLSSKQ